MNQLRSIRSKYKGYGPCSACGDGDTALEYHTHDPLPQSYTLDELEQLARQWKDNMNLLDEDGEKDLSIPLVLSVFLKWARKREREVGDGTDIR